MTVRSRQGPDKLPNFFFYEWYNLFCSFSESEAHLRVKTEAFKHKQFRVWTGVRNTKNLIFSLPGLGRTDMEHSKYICWGKKRYHSYSYSYKTWKD